MNNFFKGILGGIFIAMGTLLAVSIFGATDNYYLGALAFPIGLLLVSYTPARIVTSSCLNYKELKVTDYLWITFGNIIGAVCFGMCVYLSRSVPPNMTTVAEQKAAIEPLELILRALLCNLFVCGGVYAGKKSNSPLLIYAAAFAFYALHLNHCVADAFIMLFQPSILSYIYIVIISCLCNIISGLALAKTFDYLENL